MSWMDSWSRPAKSQATPAPYYLLPGGEATPYCRTCGRVISSRKVNAALAASTSTPAPSSSSSSSSKNNKDGSSNKDAGSSATSGHSSQQPKYCSSRCRNTKLRKLDREIEATFVRALLSENEGGGRGGGENDQTTTATGPLGGDGNNPAADSPHINAGREDDSRSKPGKRSKKNKAVKGDPRVLVSCDEIEKAVFGDRSDPEKTFGRKKDRASRVLPAAGEDDIYTGTGIATGTTTTTRTTTTTTTHDDPCDAEAPGDADSGVAIPVSEHGGVSDEEPTVVDGDVLARLSVRSGTRVRPPQTVSEVNGSVGGEKGRAERGGESEEMARRRREGQRRAHEKEMVRCAARRGVVFGFFVTTTAGDHTVAVVGADETRKKQPNDAEGGDGGRRMCEAVMQGKVVEPSYAKGDWAIRWRG